AQFPQAAGQSLSQVDPFPASAQAALLEGPCRGAPLVWSGQTVLARIERHAAERPGAPAVTFAGDTLTYSDLVGTAQAIAARLRDEGVAQGARVGLHMERTPLAIAAILGIMVAGAAYVPLDVAAPDARKAAILDDGAVDWVVSADPQVVAGRSAIALADLPTPPVSPREPSGPALPQGQDEAYVIFTSGSTGRPKGVSVGHDNLGFHVEARQAAYPDGPIERFLLTFSLTFDGSVTGLFCTLADGGTLVLPRALDMDDPERMAALIAREAVTHTIMIPSQWALVLAGAAPGDLASLKSVVVAGEAASRDLIARHGALLPSTRLINEYGPTETTVWATYEVVRTDAAGPVPIGSPIPGTSAFVVDDRGQLAPPGTVGELWIGGPHVARGYVGAPSLTDARFVADRLTPGAPEGARLYRTGDRVSLTPAGKLQFHGRADDQVKVSGYRIELDEVATALLTDPRIEEAVVVTHRASASAAPILVAHVAGASVPSADDVQQHARRHLPAYMVPHRVVAHDRLPKTAAGKVDRQRLPAPSLNPVDRVAPQGPTEEAVAEAWSDILGIGDVGRFDDFFAIGGGSLAGMQVISRLRRALNVEAELVDLLEAPRLADFAARVSTAKARQGPATAAPKRRQRARVDLGALKS
ncbi:MAG: non-ribosomal peptide synthetase, partial [Pseudomonadota bacterium]